MFWSIKKKLLPNFFQALDLVLNTAASTRSTAAHLSTKSPRRSLIKSLFLLISTGNIICEICNNHGTVQLPPSSQRRKSRMICDVTTSTTALLRNVPRDLKARRCPVGSRQKSVLQKKVPDLRSAYRQNMYIFISLYCSSLSFFFLLSVVSRSSPLSVPSSF